MACYLKGTSGDGGGEKKTDAAAFKANIALMRVNLFTTLVPQALPHSQGCGEQAELEQNMPVLPLLQVAMTVQVHGSAGAGKAQLLSCGPFWGYCHL